MKKLFFTLLLFPIITSAQSGWNMNLLGTYDYHTTQGNDIWGWVDASGNEYALVGLRSGLSVVNVTNPSSPSEEFFISDVNSTWRDVKTWGNYAYVTTEANAGLLIVDLTDMTGNTYSHVTQFTNNNGGSVSFTSAHDIYIDENGIAYIFGAGGSGPQSNGAIFLDLDANPTNPIYLGEWSDKYIHDGMVRGDTMYAGCIQAGKVFIVDVSNKSNPTTIGSHSTPNNFTHNAWVSDNGNYVFTTDETSDAYLTAYDISDLNNIQEVDRIQSNPGSNSIPHNTFVDGNFLITSYYRDGTTVHDITYPDNMIQVAYYDSYAGSGNGGDGCWGTYPYLPSGNIISSDINSGAGGKGRLLIYERNFQQASFLSGTVTNANTGVPISNATIQIFSSSYTTTTNLLGDYSFGSPNSGVFQVIFSASGYSPIILNATLSSGNITILDAALFPGSGSPGCTNPLAINYDLSATIDDGNCIYCSGTWVTLNMYDTYGDGWNGNTWNATSTTGSASYGPYTIATGSSAVESFCLPDDCYDIVCDYGSWDSEVSWTLTDVTGAVLASGGAPYTDLLCITNSLGCTDPNACNYDPTATLDDGSCEYTSCCVYGCTGPTSCNYDPLATCDDGSCYGAMGCMDSTACNYNASACMDDGSCEFNSCNAVCAEDAPTGIYSSNIVHNRATINWDNMNDSMCFVDQYRISYSDDGGTSWSNKTMGAPVASCVWPCNKTDKVILNLTPATTYTYRMKTWYCGGGNSAWSANYTFTTLDDCPNLGNLAVTTPSVTKATLTWDDSNGAYSFVRLQARVDTAGSAFFNIGGVGINYGTFTKNKNGLVAGESYRAKSRTWCDPSGGAYKAPSWTSFIYWTQPTTRLNNPELTERTLSRITDLLGRKVNYETIIDKTILLHIYDDGTVEKKIVIE